MSDSYKPAHPGEKSLGSRQRRRLGQSVLLRPLDRSQGALILVFDPFNNLSLLIGFSPACRHSLVRERTLSAGRARRGLLHQRARLGGDQNDLRLRRRYNSNRRRWCYGRVAGEHEQANHYQRTDQPSPTK